MKLAWIDIETTGLNPNFDDVLEVALVMTNEHFTVLDSEHWLHRPTMHALTQKMSAFVRDMHTKSGLLDEVMNGCHSMSRIDETCSHIIAKHEPPKSVMLAGSSVHFDRSFMRVHMPRTDALLHYRHFDVSVLQRAAEMWSPGRLEGVACCTTPSKHRAQLDVLQAIEVAKHFRVNFFERFPTFAKFE